MALRIDVPCPTVRQESGKDPDGKFILSVLVKRTYTLSRHGECIVADEQLPLCEEPEFNPDDPALLVRDSDLFPYKPRSDVIVMGHAYGYTGRRQFKAVVRVGDATKQILVQGERRCTLTATGRLVFAAPDPVNRIPLSYAYAYGGRDAVAEAAVVDKHTAAKMPGIPPEMLSLADCGPFDYPRNPCGCGYLIKATAQAVEGLRLPNLEDPLDPLAPDRMEVGSPLLWPSMPLPQSTGWVSYDWFPRIVGIGIFPVYQRTENPFSEVVRNYIPDSVLRPARYDQADPFHLTCGASLGLQFPYLRGGEAVMLQNIHPMQQDFSFCLPSEKPNIWTDGRKGLLNATKPVIHTVVIEPDEDRVSVVWRGAATALRPYMEAELAKMPLKVEWV